MNTEIEKLLTNEEYDKAYSKIKEYREKEYDYDNYSYLSCYYMGTGDYESAYRVSKEAEKLNPYSIDSSYNLACAAECLGRYAEAYRYLMRVKTLQKKYNNYIVSDEILSSQIDEVKNIAAGNKNVMQEFAIIDELHSYADSNPFKSFSAAVTGAFIHTHDHRVYFAGSTNRWFESYFKVDANRDAYRSRCELFETINVGLKYLADVKEKSLMPVCLNCDSGTGKGTLADASDISGTMYTDIAQYKYSYIPVDRPTEYVSSKPAAFARPIPLNNSNGKRKRLVMSIFADSFNYKIIKEKGLEKLMPRTASFFEKGIIFDNFYSGSEWTLPSIATYWTGRHSSKHMNLDENYLIDFMRDEKVLAEYFHDEGYVTAKIGGNDAVTPVSGYNRGIDRFLYQYISQGYTAKDVVTDVIEHLRTFAGDDQYVWVDFVDLHDISGGFMRSIGVQAQIPLERRSADNKAKTTVKQTYSNNRKYIFEQELREFDFQLGRLFNYIEDNYKDEEIVISFFSDHGAAFMVDDGEPFVSWQRMNVPMMIRGAKDASGHSREIVESADYAAMMCKLAGIEYDYTGTDANLPVTLGGNREREYALSQSLFIGDPYSAALHGRDFHYYYKTEEAIRPEFRINTANAHDVLYDDDGNEIPDEARKNTFREYIMGQIGHLIKK